MLDVRQTDDGVLVRTELGIQLLWDGNNFLQVQAVASFKNRLCGLCGNFNGISRDDLLSRQGDHYKDDETWRFANSWKVGGPKACSRKNENLAKQPVCRHKRGAQLCRPLNESELFEECSTQLNPLHYLESCRKDMCECPTGKCYCDSLAAYATECARLGIPLHDWKRETQCDAASIEAATAATAKRQLAALRRKQRPTPTSLPVKPHRRKHSKKVHASQSEFLSKHVPQTLLIHHHGGRTPPPIH